MHHFCGPDSVLMAPGGGIVFPSRLQIVYFLNKMQNSANSFSLCHVLRWISVGLLISCTAWAITPLQGIQDRPAISGPHPSTEPAVPDGIVATTCHLWLRFYQTWISVVSRSPCRMEPSCSNYALQAIQKHGPAIGVVMTADRLLHEADEQKAMRVVRSPGNAYCPDPVSNNDFWWYKQ